MTGYAEFYISVDIESTGPIPGDYSMSSFGAFIAGARTREGNFVRFSRHEKQNKFYRELKPISENFVPEAIAVGLLEGFDQEDPTGELHHQWMKDHGHEPAEAMGEFVDWINAAKELHGARPLFAAYPASFDWLFVYWYFQHFGVESPFGFSGVRDIKEMYATKANVPYSKASKRHMPLHLLKSDAPHTHHALDDAIGQGHLLLNILEWDPKAP